MLKSGRTIAARREKLETASERTAAKEKVKKRKILRVSFTSFIFLGILIIGVIAIIAVSRKREENEPFVPTIVAPYAPTIEVIDADTGTESKMSSTMKEYIGEAEADFRELGYVPIKVVRPVGSVREVDFYLDGFTGYIKLTTDRGSAVSVEDADRMIRYLRGIGVTDFTYVDVRIDRKAYWK